MHLTEARKVGQEIKCLEGGEWRATPSRSISNSRLRARERERETEERERNREEREWSYFPPCKERYMTREKEREREPR